MPNYKGHRLCRHISRQWPCFDRNIRPRGRSGSRIKPALSVINSKLPLTGLRTRSPARVVISNLTHSSGSLVSPSILLITKVAKRGLTNLSVKVCPATICIALDGSTMAKPWGGATCSTVNTSHYLSSVCLSYRIQGLQTRSQAGSFGDELQSARQKAGCRPRLPR